MNNSSLPTLAKYGTLDKLVDYRRYPDQFPRIKAFNLEVAAKRMVPIVWAACLYKGQDISDEKLAFISKALVSEILADGKYGLRELCWEEIGIAIRAAVLGEGRELYGITVSSLYSALVDYANGAGHVADKKA